MYAYAFLRVVEAIGVNVVVVVVCWPMGLRWISATIAFIAGFTAMMVQSAKGSEWHTRLASQVLASYGSGDLGIPLTNTVLSLQAAWSQGRFGCHVLRQCAYQETSVASLRDGMPSTAAFNHNMLLYGLVRVAALVHHRDARLNELAAASFVLSAISRLVNVSWLQASTEFPGMVAMLLHTWHLGNRRVIERPGAGTPCV